MNSPTPTPCRFDRASCALIATVDSQTFMGEDATDVCNAILDEVQGSTSDATAIGLDITRVSSMNSIAIGAIVALQTSVLRLNLDFALIGISPLIRDVLESSRLSQVFTLFDTRAEFLRTLKAP